MPIFLKKKWTIKEIKSVNEHISQARLKQTFNSELSDLSSDKELKKMLKHIS